MRIEKLDRGASDLGVEIVRSRQDNLNVSDSNDHPAATIIHLDQQALQSSHLGDWIDQIVALEEPVILTMPNGKQSLSDGSSVARRRIELLEIEQIGWQLSEREPRCVVVASWTELDWGLKNGQLSVWAPSRTVFDSSDESIAHVQDAHELSKWLARQLNAEKHCILDIHSAALKLVPSS